MNKKRILKNLIYPILSLALFLSTWAIISAVENKPLALPQVDVVFNEFFHLLGQNSTWVALSGTLLNTLFAFLLSVVVAFILSVITTFFKPLHKILSPIITILRSAPTMAVILLSILWLDNDDTPIFIGFLIAFPLLYSSFRLTLTSVDEKTLEMAKVFNVKKLDVLKTIYLPSVASNFISSMQSVISLTVKVVIAAEVMAYASKTIGFEMIQAKIDIETATLLAYTVLAIVLSFILEGIFALINKLARRKYGNY